MTPRGRCFLSGARWGSVALDPIAVVDDGVAGVDRAWPQLADDERVLFLLGYEASLGGRSGDASLGPDAFAWRCRVVAAAPWEPVAARSPRLSTTEQQHQRHLERVRRCRELLLDGVLYQANLAHRLEVEARDHAEGLRFFQSAAPTACSAFVDVTDSQGTGWGSLISLSPERFIEADLRAHTAQAFPIKGTLPRSCDPQQLLSSTKDQAEHVMIVDLLRNDLGRLAVAGGVTVESLMHLVSTSSVHHLESTISARLRDDVDVTAILASCAPGGSITGAPKSSAVETIAALEDGARGPYTGVLGVVDHRGVLRSSLLIRTWIRPDSGPGALHVGGGIVVDSDPEAEWQETLQKARAFGPVTVRA